VLIANDAYGVSDSIRRLCDPVPFRAIGVSTLQKRMKEICRFEDIACGEDALSAIAESSAGDMRTAVNMLFGSSTGKTSISAGDINTAQKDERATIFDLVGGVFAGAPDRELQKLSFECDEKPDSVMQWIEESIPLMHDPKRRIRAYGRISRADVYLGRTMRRQYFTLWRYATSMMTLGVASENAGAGFRTRIMPPSRWKRMSTAKKQKAVRRTLAASLAEGYSIPESQIQSQYLDLLSRFAEKDPAAFCERHNLDVDQMGIVLHDKAAAAAAVKTVQQAAKERDTKVKKMAASKRAEMRKLEEQLEALRMQEPPVPETPPAAEELPLEEPPEEKKLAPKQATLDFF
ncbi:MAG: replication factor C large subunit, partial [Bacilli bacterium]|nr:replication factor C large subunit [Bacilli bacterium]